MYDLIILGGGAAGFSAAMKAEELKAKTLLINNSAVGIGGTCINVGCMPTKYLLHVADAIQRERKFCSFSVDFREIFRKKNTLIGKLREDKYEDVLSDLNVDFIEGDAKFVSKNEVEVNGSEYSGKKFVIATGSSPFIPPVKGLDEVDYLTNKSALELEELPESMIILGSGPLALEFAQVFSRFGSEVTIVFRGGRILKREEPELANLLQLYLEEEGIKFIGNAEMLSISEKGMKKVKLRVAGEEKEIEAEHILIATGRKSNTGNISIELTGVRTGRRDEVIVDEYMRAADNIFAAGDVVGEPMLETVAAREGMIAANNALSDKKLKMDYRVVPHAVFTYPAVGSVGLTDEKALSSGIRCRCSTILMELLPKAHAMGDTRGVLKMVVNSKNQEIVGIHILSENAADLINEGAMIIRNRMTVDEVIDTLHVFPTLSESIKLAAQSFRRDVTKMSCCVE
jgi:mercuric reductase